MIRDIPVEERTGSILSERHEALTASANNVPAYINTTKSSIPDVFKNFEYPVSAWPVIVDADLAKKFKAISTRIPELLMRIPSLCFNDDVKRLADFYFGGNQMIAEFALVCHKKAVEVSSRLDLVQTHNGPKVLEANIGSGIGGWQLCSFLEVIKQHHNQLAEWEQNDEVAFVNTQQEYLSFLLDKIFQYVPGMDSEVNIFVSLGEMGGDDHGGKVIGFLNSLMQQVLAEKGLTGGIFTGELTKINLSGANQLIWQGKRLHGVLKMGEGDLPSEVFRSFIMDGVYLPDNLGTMMYNDKRNLALLVELATDGKLSEADTALVLDAIPWTSIVEDKKVVFKGQPYNMLSLLESRKNQLVIKVANGMQGIDVYVGKFLTTKAWGKAIHNALGARAYVVQEFSDSQDFIAPNKENQWEPHKIIWGTFGFGSRYAGSFVRMSAVKTDVGVINAATGAVEALVFEAKQRSVHLPQY